LEGFLDWLDGSDENAEDKEHFTFHYQSDIGNNNSYQEFLFVVQATNKRSKKLREHGAQSHHKFVLPFVLSSRIDSLNKYHL
jgi:hypothetical protein